MSGAPAARRLLPSPAAADALMGQDVATSPWLAVDQARIDRFAEATGDHQWIHVDPTRAAQGPYGGTIAHGLLTLSLLPGLLDAAVGFQHMAMGVNYGLDRVRFPAPVPAGSRIRVQARLLACTPLPDHHGTRGRKLVWQLTTEREGVGKPVCIAETISHRYWGAPNA